MINFKEFEKELTKIGENIKNTDNEDTTFLNVIEKEYAENIITTFLKFIMDPKRNGVGWMPITKLLEAVEIWDTYDFTEEDLENVELVQEFVIMDNRRIDLVIKTEKVWIVIENKINAWQGPNQLEDYYQAIEEIREHKQQVLDIVYIYLKPNYNKSEPGNYFKPLLYSNLIQKLEDIEQNCFAEPEKYNFLKDFIKHCRRYFVKETQVDFENEYVNFYLKYEPMINKVKDAYLEESEKLYKAFQERLKEGLCEAGEGDDDAAARDRFVIQRNPQRTYLQIIKASWEELHWGIHYELFAKDDFYKMLGNKKFEIIFTLHIEGWVHREYKDIFKEEGIEHRKGEFSKIYDFTTNEQFEENMMDIIKTIKEIDKEKSEQIRKAINKININNV